MTAALRLRRLLCVGMALLAAAALPGCAALGGHLDIDSTELQSRIAKRFPARHCKTPLLCVELSNPVVSLDEGDDRMGLAMDVKLVFGLRERTGHLGLAGRPRYAPSQGQLFLDDLEVTRLELAELPGEYAEWARAGATLVARHALQAQPVYTLDDSTAKGTLAKRSISDVRVVGGKLRVTFGDGAP
jgi:hypothetical protein